MVLFYIIYLLFVIIVVVVVDISLVVGKFSVGFLGIGILALCAVCVSVCFLLVSECCIALSLNASIQLSHSVKVNFGIFELTFKDFAPSHSLSSNETCVLKSLVVCIASFNLFLLLFLLLFSFCCSHLEWCFFFFHFILFGVFLHITRDLLLCVHGETLSYLEINLLTKPPSDYVLYFE